jgi:hypothetical protein
MGKSRKLPILPFTGDISDYLVNLQDWNQIVASVGQAFPDQVEVHHPDDIVHMIYMHGPFSEDDDVFL